MSGIEAWSTTAASNNASPPNGAPEGMAPSAVNDTMRNMMAATRTWFEDAQWTNRGYTHTYASGTSVTVAGVNVTSVYTAGRRVKAVGSSTGTIYGVVASSSFATNTTINFTWDSGSLSNEALTIYVSIITPTNNALSIPYSPASSSGPASLAFAEDTDNGANKVTLSAPSSLAGDVSVTLPSAAGTLATLAGTETLTNKTLSGALESTTSKTTTYTTTATDDFISASASGGAFTITLIAASGLAGKRLKIVKTDSTLNAVTIDGNASETISGNLTITLNTQWECVEIECDGSNWVVTNRHIPSVGGSYSPVLTGQGNGSTFTNQTTSGVWSRLGRNIVIDCETAISGAPGGGTGYMLWTVPTGVTIDTSATAMPSGTLYENTHGIGTVFDTSASQTSLISAGWNSVASRIVAYSSGVGTTPVSATVPYTLAAGDRISFKIILPVSGWSD